MVFPGVSDLDKTNLWLSPILVEIEVHRGYNPSGDTGWWHVCIVSSCLPACCSVFMTDIELFCGQRGIVPGVSVRTTKPSRFNWTKLVHFWLKLYRRSLIPVNNRLPHMASEIDLSVGRCFTPSPRMGCVFRTCLKALRRRATKRTTEQPLLVLPKRMPCSEIPFQDYSCLRSRCRTGKCSPKQSQQKASCVG